MSNHLIAGCFEVVKEIDTVWIRNLRTGEAMQCHVDEVTAAIDELWRRLF